MRGVDERTGELFSYVDLEARVRADHPLRTIRTIVNEALSALEHEFAALYARIWPALHPAREAHQGHAPAGLLFHPLRTTADGAPRIRSPVPVVRRPRRR